MGLAKSNVSSASVSLRCWLVLLTLSGMSTTTGKESSGLQSELRFELFFEILDDSHERIGDFSVEDLSIDTICRAGNA